MRRFTALLSIVAITALVAAVPPVATDTPQLVARGYSALEASDYAAAEALFARIQGQGRAEAQIGLSRAAFEQGHNADALRFAEQATAAAAREPAVALKAATQRAQVLIEVGRAREAIALLEALGALKNSRGTHGQRARLVLGSALIDAGRRADGEIYLHEIIEEYNDGAIPPTDAEGLALVGRAAFLRRSPKDASRAFKESEGADKSRVETHLWAAELFLDKYDAANAETELTEALALAPRNADALVLLARVKLDPNLDFESAEKLANEALTVNPKHTGALAVKAGLALREMAIAKAENLIVQGLAVNANHLELLSLKAASRFLDDDKPGFEKANRETLSHNAEYARLYTRVSEYAEWEHRYDDMLKMLTEATKLDPEDGKAWADLGLTQVRSGDEKAGLQNLTTAWRFDKFNVRVFNTLNLFEREIPSRYDLVTQGAFQVRYAKNERAILDRYIPRFLGDAFNSIKTRYGFTPATPIQVELYASRQSFSIRTSGLPNIGIQGVCFGRVIAAVSPAAEVFNIGNVLWHELAHVFAVQISKNHVPRWFTEGLSEYETVARRPEWARHLEPELYRAITNHTLPGVLEMNHAFTHASDASEVALAYYEASQRLVWTVETFGMPKVVEALRAWGSGKKTLEVIPLAFGLTVENYDVAYERWQLAKLSRYQMQYAFIPKNQALDVAKNAVERAPGTASAHVDLAVAHMRAKKVSDASLELAAALAIEPQSPDAHFVAAELAQHAGDGASARAHLHAMVQNAHDGYAVQALFADIEKSQNDAPRYKSHLEAAHRFDPTQSEPLKGLFELAIKEKNETAALPILEKLARLEPHDRAVWRMFLEKLVTAKRWSDAVRVGESAIFVDVMGSSTHMAFAQALAAENAHERAIYELETALLCKNTPSERALAHTRLAAELLTIHRDVEARTHREAAEKIANESPSEPRP